MKKRGFSSTVYLQKEAEAILARIKRFDRLYLEIGGKPCRDFHASRVLPGYDPKNKIKLLHKLGKPEIIYCINSNDIQNKRIIHDFGFTADKHAIHDIQTLTKEGIKVSSVAITLYSGQKSIHSFKKKLESLGIPVYVFTKIKGYPNNIKNILNGFSKQPYIPAKSNLIIMMGVASNSGKMGVALSQIYHEIQSGMKTGFAKLETFPIWNLPLNHPINLAYEAATADLGDRNMLDKLYRKSHNHDSVNYNRDIENFIVLKKIYSAFTSNDSPFGYNSPTEMGINMASKGILSDAICREAAKKEILRRYTQYRNDYLRHKEKKSTLERMELIIKKLNHDERNKASR